MNSGSVTVPPSIESIFAKAEQSTREYFNNRIERPDQGTIEISGERYILIRAASLSVEFVDLIAVQYPEASPAEAQKLAADFLFDLAHANGKSDARHSHQRTGATDPIERLSLGPTHFAHRGWASVMLDPASRPVPNENYVLVYEHPYSFEADAWQRRGIIAERPVCAMNAGYSSGWCEESFGIPLVATEISCRAAGNDTCRFVMAPPWRMEEHLIRQGAAPRSAGGNVSVPEFFQRKRLEEKLARKDKHIDLLSKRIADHEAEIKRLRDEIASARAT